MICEQGAPERIANSHCASGMLYHLMKIAIRIRSCSRSRSGTWNSFCLSRAGWHQGRRCIQCRYGNRQSIRSRVGHGLPVFLEKLKLLERANLCAWP